MYWNLPVSYKGVTNVQHNFNYYFDMLTNKCCNIFKWEGLPETVDERALNLSLILRGKVCFTEFDGKLYALDGNVGGEPNVYYEPQFFIIANPILGSKEVRIRRKDGSNSLEDLDGIIMGNSDVDIMSCRATGGLFGLIYQYAGLLADNVSSLNCSQINGRVSQIWTADTDALARTTELIVKDIYEGKPYKMITQDMIDKVGVLPAAETGQTNTLLNLMEIHQFFLAQFYSELGIAAQGNLKRERINTSETELMTGNLDINIENMMRNRQEAVDRINKMFGTSISVTLNPSIYYEETNNAILPEEVESESEDIIEQDEAPQETSAEIQIKEVKERGDEE